MSLATKYKYNKKQIIKLTTLLLFSTIVLAGYFKTMYYPASTMDSISKMMITKDISDYPVAELLDPNTSSNNDYEKVMFYSPQSSKEEVEELVKKLDWRDALLYLEERR